MSGKLDELDWVQIIVNYGELSDSIKALTENIEGQELRLTDLENLVDQHLRPQLREQPITFGISNSGPVSNKEDLVDKLITAAMQWGATEQTSKRVAMDKARSELLKLVGG